MGPILITVGIFVAFFFLVVRPLQKHQTKYRGKETTWELTGNEPFKDDDWDIVTNPSYSIMSCNIYH